MIIPGTLTSLDAEVIPRRPSREERAWSGERLTVRLTRDFDNAIRVSMTEEGLAGRWFAIGDYIHPRSEYARLHALPPIRSGPLRGRRAFLFQAAATLHVGSILNVGRCSALYEFRTGGGYQAELLSDLPEPTIRLIDGLWLDQMGHA